MKGRLSKPGRKWTRQLYSESTALQADVRSVLSTNMIHFSVYMCSVLEPFCAPTEACLPTYFFLILIFVSNLLNKGHFYIISEKKIFSPCYIQLKKQ